MTSRAPQRFEVVDAHLQRAPAIAVRGEVEFLDSIVCPPGPMRRLFKESGIADLLFLYASPAEAAAALVPAG